VLTAPLKICHKHTLQQQVTVCISISRARCCNIKRVVNWSQWSNSQQSVT